jgi:hypothetical protein
LNSIKRISPTVFEMKVPDALTAQFDYEPDNPVGPDQKRPDASIAENFLDDGDNDGTD